MSRLTRLFASAALVVSLVTLLSRLAGVVRWLVFSPTVGAGVVGTAYQSANQIPNILFEVVAGGALAGAVVPLLAKPLASGDTATVSRVASALMTWALSVTIPLTLLVVAFHEQLAALLVRPDSASFDPVTAFLLMFAPQLPFYAIGGVLTGVLQAHRRFFWPAFAPLLSSLVVITTYLLYATTSATADAAPASALALLGWGTTCGVVALALPLVLPTTRTGVRFRPTWTFPSGVGSRAARLAGAGMSALLAQQFAMFVTMLVSNRVGGTGVYVVFGYINAVYLLPYAVLAVPIATVVFPRLAAQAARSRAEAGATIAATTSAIVWVGVLGLSLLFAAAAPLQSFFTAIDAAAGNPAVPFDALGTGVRVIAFAVPGWCVVAWSTRVFYALEHSRFAAIATTTGWIVVALSVLAAVVLPSTGQAAERTLVVVCAAYALGMSVAGILLLVLTPRAAGPGSLAGLPGHLAKAVLACVLACVCGSLVARWTLPGAEAALPVAGPVLSGMGAGLVALLVVGAVLVLTDRGVLRDLRIVTARESVD